MCLKEHKGSTPFKATMKKRITIKEKDYHNYKEWEKSVIVLRWEHDFINHEYSIDYKE